MGETVSGEDNRSCSEEPQTVHACESFELKVQIGHETAELRGDNEILKLKEISHYSGLDAATLGVEV